MFDISLIIHALMPMLVYLNYISKSVSPIIGNSFMDG